MKLFKNTNRLKTLTGLFIIILIVGQHQVNCVFAVLSSLSSMVTLGYSVYGILNDAHDTYNKFQTASTQDVMDKVSEIADNLNKIGTKLDKKIDNALETLLRRLPLQNKIDESVQELNQYIVRIDSLYNDFEDYVRHPKEYDDIEVDKIVEAALSRDPGDVRDVIDKMHSLIVPGRVGALKKSLLLLLAEETLEYVLDTCDTGAPPQQRIFELYSIIIVTEVRGYAMSGFSYLKKSMDDNVDLMKSIMKLQQKFELRSEQYILTLKTALSIASRQFRRCEPASGNERDETFAEFVRFMQIFVVQETALTHNQDCDRDCPNMGRTRIHVGGCSGYECHGSPTTCYGQLDWCGSLGSGTVCQFEPDNPRRFQFINWEGDHDKPCTGYMAWPKTYNDIWAMCDVCRCMCIEDVFKSRSSHFVSMIPMESDIYSNKLVTGVRFVMKNKILFIQIQEGILQGNGTIPDETSKWQEIGDYEYKMEESIEENRFIFTVDGDNELMDDQIGVLKVDQRRFFLDKLSIPDDHAVTGIRFNRLPKEENTNTPFYIEIRATKINFEEGKLLVDEESRWMSYKDMSYGKDGYYRQELLNSNVGSPLKKNKVTVNSVPNEFIDLDGSSFWGDAGQTVLPLLDILPLYGNPLTPLSGIGLYHKAPSDAGGYFTLIAEGIDKGRYIKVEE